MNGRRRPSGSTEDGKRKKRKIKNEKKKKKNEKKYE